jgi:sterol desaturase/sphingolipid hydroxylase (fatty acid hydroxylase superfamily)
MRAAIATRADRGPVIWRRSFMPTPFELLLDPISLAIFGMYAALVLWEAIAPARVLPTIRGWRLAGLAAFVFYFFLSSYLPLAWADALTPIQLFDLSALGAWAGAAVGLLVYEFGAYVYHRAMHRFAVLWRGLHQMHHSAERLDTFSAFWFSPLDMVGWTLLGSVSLTVVGLTAEATTLVLLIVTLLTIFQHSNVRTPRWLGYFVQRPEAHSHHHERGVHDHNFADLPIFDIVFGSFHNPREFAPATGFYEGASRRIVEMLVFRDVSTPRAA